MKTISDSDYKLFLHLKRADKKRRLKQKRWREAHPGYDMLMMRKLREKRKTL